MTVFVVLSSTGSEFQREGAATEKALEPHFVLTRGTNNILVSDDLSNLDFLAAHKDTKVAEKYAAQNEELKKQMEVLARSNKDMKDRLDSLEIKKKGKK